jgi:protein-tyrosine phosphatase
MAGIRARCVQRRDFERFDLILAMDRRNLAALQSLCPEQHRDKLAMFLDYAAGSDVDEVPDPYFEGPASFELALDLIEGAAQGLIEALRRA